MFSTSINERTKTEDGNCLSRSWIQAIPSKWRVSNVRSRISNMDCINKLSYPFPTLLGKAHQMFLRVCVVSFISQRCYVNNSIPFWLFLLYWEGKWDSHPGLGNWTLIKFGVIYNLSGLEVECIYKGKNKAFISILLNIIQKLNYLTNYAINPVAFCCCSLCLLNNYCIF